MSGQDAANSETPLDGVDRPGGRICPPVSWRASGQVQPAAPVEAPAGRKLSFLRISDFLNDGARLLIAPPATGSSPGDPVIAYRSHCLMACRPAIRVDRCNSHAGCRRVRGFGVWHSNSCQCTDGREASNLIKAGDAGGLVIYSSNPASFAFCMSASCPYPVTATISAPVRPLLRIARHA